MEFKSDAEKWTAVANRDTTADGAFVYCVKTTKIFCRPVCKARLARRSNVEFFAIAEQAERAGYRACKRCRPDLSHFTPEADRINEVCKMLRSAPKHAPLPQLERIARHAGLTKHHFHRLFKRETGLTPRQYAIASRNSGRSDDVASPKTGYENPSNPAASGVGTLSPWEIATPISNLTKDPEFIETQHAPAMEFSEWDYGLEELLLLEDCLIDKTMPEIEGSAFGQKAWTPSNELAGSTIQYTTIVTTHGILLIAFEQDTICKLDLGTSVSEVLHDLDSTHPASRYSHALIEDLNSSDFETRKGQVDKIVEALERPSGKLLQL